MSVRRGEMPRGFANGKVGDYDAAAIDKLAAVISKRIRNAKPTQRTIGVAMDSMGRIYAVTHLSAGFQRILKYEQYLVVGVYDTESRTPDIADDIRAHAKEIGL